MTTPPDQLRYRAFVLTTALLSLVSDGWSGKPSPKLHQVLLLPCTLGLGLCLLTLLKSYPETAHEGIVGSSRWVYVPLAFFAAGSFLMIVAEARHFRQFGYRLTPIPCCSALCGVLASTLLIRYARAVPVVFVAVLTCFVSGAVLSLVDFPLNYLRSDMLPVIGWADLRLWHHLNPYATMHVGARLYDFPYLPGMLVAYLPATVLGLDLRWANLFYSLGMAALLYSGAAKRHRLQVIWLIALFQLCPFMQYRHDLYLQPHWFVVTLAAVLLAKGRVHWSAFIWGVSCAIYQFSWVVVPFFLLHMLRKQGFGKALQALGVLLVGCFLVAGPFLPVALQQVEHNTVGQWNHLSHALADPINLSYWLTFLLRPDQLRWVQAFVLTSLFGVCVWKGRCSTVTDTFRYMAVALAVFIPLNVLVDGYFYLTLLLFLLIFVASANGWWSSEDGSDPLTRKGGLAQAITV